jgi:hypothetical protein
LSNNEDNKYLDNDENSQVNRTNPDKDRQNNLPNKYNPSSGNFRPFLTEQMENMIKELKIDSTNHKISNDYQENILTAVIDCLLYYHYNSLNINHLRNFFFEFNENLCENPLETEELEDLWIQGTAHVETINDNDVINSSLDEFDNKEPQEDPSKSFYDIFGEPYPEFKNQNGSNNSDSNDDNSNSSDSPINERINDETIIEDKNKNKEQPIITSQDIKFVLDTISKQAPYDKTQIKQIFYGICSSQTSTKIHHNINSKKSGEGKSYILKLVSDLFPDSFTMKFNDVSDKALHHQKGFEAVKDDKTGKYVELNPILNQLELEIEELEETIEAESSKGQQKDKQQIKSWKSQIKDLQQKIKDLNSNAVKIIDLDNKAFIFLDTPNEGLFNNLMSILSQDSKEQQYLFTDKDSSGKRLQSRTVILRGSPLIITTRLSMILETIVLQKKIEGLFM